MNKIINNYSTCGLLVKKDIKEFTTHDGDDVIGGSIVLRTTDASEHEFNLFAFKYKKDENKQFTDELGYFYKEYLKIMDEFVDMEEDKDNPTVVNITDGYIDINDYKGNDGEVKSYNRISCRFVNRVDEKNIAYTPQIARFEVEGIVKSIESEIDKENAPTGRLVVQFINIAQKADGFGKNAKYEASKLVPIKMIVNADVADEFKKYYFDGCYTKFIGTPINITTTKDIVEKQAFGKDAHHIIKTTEKYFSIESGSSASTMQEHDITDDMLKQLISSRNNHIREIKDGFVKTDNNNPFGGGTQPTSEQQKQNNPFSNPFSNPFASN